MATDKDKGLVGGASDIVGITGENYPLRLDREYKMAKVSERRSS